MKECDPQKTVLVQLVSERLKASPADLRSLTADGLRIITVANRYRDCGNHDARLREAVLKGLNEQQELLSQTAKLQPPDVDSDAFQEISRVYDSIPESTPAQRRAFLDEFYDLDESDSGVR